MTPKKKICSICGKETYLFKSNPKTCKSCYTKQKAIEAQKLKPKTLSPKSGTIYPKRKTTGEKALFYDLYNNRAKGRCEVTGIPFEFTHWCGCHILGKQAYPSFRLYEGNIIIVIPEVHSLYDNSDKETLLSRFPKAIIIYQKKEKLKAEYYARFKE